MENSGFFNAEYQGEDSFGNPTFDKVYYADDFAKYFNNFIGNGIYSLESSIVDELKVTVTSPTSMIVLVATGKAFINGYWYENDSSKQLTVSAADTTNTRFDAVCLRLNLQSRGISLMVVTGTPAASPVLPAMVRNDVYYDLFLYKISVSANATTIETSQLTDLRSDDAYCGIASVIGDFPTESLQAQIDALKVRTYFGTDASATTGGAIGNGAVAYTGFAGGYNAKAQALGAVQLGEGTNQTENTLQFRGYQVVDASGLISASKIKPMVSTTTNNITNWFDYIPSELISSGIINVFQNSFADTTLGTDSGDIGLCLHTSTMQSCGNASGVNLSMAIDGVMGAGNFALRGKYIFGSDGRIPRTLIGDISYSTQSVGTSSQSVSITLNDMVVNEVKSLTVSTQGGVITINFPSYGVYVYFIDRNSFGVDMGIIGASGQHNITDSGISLIIRIQ